MKRYWSLALSLFVACVAHAANVSSKVAYDWFEYVGKDAVFATPLPAGGYRNPILAGFYPDPSVARAGDKFYLVNSSFTYFPAIPIFESSDLVHWRQLGHVIDRASLLKFDGLGVSRGIYAPTIHYHDGVFYVLCTLVDSGGNFLVTARDPAGPWSDPVWLPFDGIDPSLFVDADGTAYVLNNGPPEGTPLYEGHRAIWMQQIDLRTAKLLGPRKVILNGGVELSKRPIWIEGPHLFKRGEWYYLMCAEGGTGVNHSEVILRSKSAWGPFEPHAGNPILTQRDLSHADADQHRADVVINAGHADLTEAPDGSWWAVFLASRPYDGVNYNTGRETYLLPVVWRQGWPVILDHGKKIPFVNTAPRLPNIHPQAAPLSGNFVYRDEFDAATPDFGWLQVRSPRSAWFELSHGALVITPSSEPLDGSGNPSYRARRQQHMNFEASTTLRLPADGDVAAGLAAFQNGNYWYFLGGQRAGESLELFVERKRGGAVERIATRTVPSADEIRFKIAGAGREYSFWFGTGGSGWMPLLEHEDGSTLSTEVAGGFVGATVGPYARRR